MTSSPASESPINENATLSKSVRRMFWGLDLHAWEHWMLAGVVIVAIGGVVAATATYVVIKLQRLEVAQSKKELDEYKVDATAKTAAANAAAEIAKKEAATAQKHASEAQLELERLKAPRILEPDQLASLVARLKSYPNERIFLRVLPGDSEAIALASQVIGALQEAGWRMQLWRTDDGISATASGILISTVVGASPENEAASRALENSLRDAGLRIERTAPLGLVNPTAYIKQGNRVKDWVTSL